MQFQQSFGMHYGKVWRGSTFGVASMEKAPWAPSVEGSMTLRGGWNKLFCMLCSVVGGPGVARTGEVRLKVRNGEGHF